MAKEISSSQNGKMKREKLLERPPMSAELLKAAIEGDRDRLVQLLGLEEQAVRDHKITMDPSGSVLQQTEAANSKAEYDNLQSATRFGNTVLHLLVTNGHNELACMVFKKDMSLLRACNKLLETPLHCASQVGNMEVIKLLSEIAHDEVRDAFRETNHNGETVLHAAAKDGQLALVLFLMRLDREMAYRVDTDGLSPLDAAIVGGQSVLALAMLEADPSQGYIQDSNGLFPIHLAASKGPYILALAFMQLCPDLAKLQDHRGRNIFHIAAEENNVDLIIASATSFEDGSVDGEMISSMIKTTDYEGNTPLHISAMKGHSFIMKTIWEKWNILDLEAVENKAGLTAFQLSFIQVTNNNTTEGRFIQKEIALYIKIEGQHFSREFFEKVLDISVLQEKWERSQIIGLGSVLITTVAFAAAFTIPGGYNANNGTPVLGGRYMFKAFIIANTLAFIEAFKSLSTIVFCALRNPSDTDLQFANHTFMTAANCMMVAFGVGSYVVLAPVSLPIAIIVLAVAVLLGSPPALCAIGMEMKFYRRVRDYDYSSGDSRHATIINGLKIMLGEYTAPLLLIFCLAFL